MSGNNEELGQILTEIAEQNAGLLVPKHVVEAARDVAHPLHSRFEWDDSIAGEKYREDQARKLIRTVRINVTIPNKVTITHAPLFVRDPLSHRSEQGYVPLLTVRSDQDQARDVIIAEFKRVVNALIRAQKVAAILGLDDDVEQEIERVSQMLGRVSVRDQPQGSA